MEGQMQRCLLIVLCVFVFYQDMITFAKAKEADKSYHARNTESEGSYDERELDESELEDDSYLISNLNADRRELSYSRQKRGPWSIIGSILMGTVTIGSTAASLVSAITGGCSYYPDICTNKDKIKELEGQIKDISKEYDGIYYANKFKFLNLQNVMINNQYVMFYINDTFRKVNVLTFKITEIVETVSMDFKKMKAMYGKDSAGNITDIAGAFVYEYENIVKLIHAQSKNQIIYLAVEKIGQLIVSKAASYLKNVADVVKPQKGAPVKGLTVKMKFKNFFSKYAKYTGRIFKQIGSDIKNAPKNAVKWLKSNNKWSKFKGSIKTSLLKQRAKINTVKNYFTPGKTGKYRVQGKKFKFPKAKVFGGFLQLALVGITKYIEISNWKKVSDKLKDSVGKYQDYLKTTQQSLKEVKDETIKLKQSWSDVKTAFQKLVQNFVNITDEAKKNTKMSEVFGLVGSPVDTSHEFFRTDFKVVTDEKDIKKKQEIAIDFFKKNGGILSKLNDKFKMRRDLLTFTKQDIKDNKGIKAIYDAVKRQYKNSNSDVIKSASSELKETDIVCATAFLFANKTEYDYYPLGKFRQTKCNITQSDFSKMKEDAAKKRVKKYLFNKVKELVPKRKSPLSMFDIIHGLYSESNDKNMKDFGSNLKLKHVICEIASQNPKLKSYFLYDLSDFRPDCSLSDDKFKEINDRVERLNKMKQKIANSMDICLDYDFCLCPSRLAAKNKLTVAQVNSLIDAYKQEKKKGCNYVENNNKCSWECLIHG